MKLWAKVKFEEDETAGKLINAFFEQFNPANSISIVNRVAKLDIIFQEQPPQQLIESLSIYKNVDLTYGKELSEYQPTYAELLEPTEAEDTPCDFPEQAITAKNTSYLPEKASSKSVPSNNGEESSLNISQLQELAKVADSFENFAELIAQWLNLGKRKALFVQFAIASCEVNTISWKELRNYLQKKDCFYEDWEKAYIVQKIKFELQKYAVTAIPLLCEISKYKNYHFTNNSDVLSQNQESSNDFTGDNIQDEEIIIVSPPEDIPMDTNKKRVHMKCIPENIPFEKALANIDKASSIEDRVRYVLNYMGLNNKQIPDQNLMVSLAVTAVGLKTISIKTLPNIANIPEESALKARMLLSSLVNDFILSFTINRPIKIIDFLKDLQKVVLTESEFNSLSNQL